MSVRVKQKVATKKQMPVVNPQKKAPAVKPASPKAKSATRPAGKTTMTKESALSSVSPKKTKAPYAMSVGHAPRARGIVKKASAGILNALKGTSLVAKTRNRLGLTQELFARLVGVSQRSVSAWEGGGEIGDASVRRIRELERLADELQKSMRADFIPTWLVSANEGLGGLSPLEAMERGESDRVWRSVFLLGSGIPI
jgi:DNA-binding transcriptional regulator YiaG